MKSPQNLAIQDKYKFGDACGQPSKETNDSGNNNHSQTARHANPGARIQAALLLPLWLAFMVGWWRVLRNGPAADLARSFELLAGIAALYGLTLVLWIRHNVGIWQRKGPRRTVRAVAAHYSHDALGNAVRCMEPEAFCAQHIIIEVTGGEKLYRSSRRPHEFESPEYHANHVAVH
jgi:hypothetical protein